MNLVISHAYSDSNKGDLAIVLATIVLVREVYPNASLTLQSVFPSRDPEFSFHYRFLSQLGVCIEEMVIPSPYADNKRHSVIRNVLALLSLLKSAVTQSLITRFEAFSFLNRNQAKAIRTLKTADVLILKGGQYIYNDQKGIRGFLYLSRMLHPLFLAARFKKSAVVLGHSIGPLQGKIGFGLAKSALSKCTRLVVRENETYALMKSMGLEGKTIEAPDLAFLIVPRKPRVDLPIMGVLKGRKCLGVTVVNWSFPEAADPIEAREAYCQALVEVCKRASARLGVDVVLFPQVTVSHHGESDSDLIEIVHDELQAVGVPVHDVTADLWPEELSYLYGQCYLFLGTRLHSCILAAGAGVPVIAIRYQGVKTEGVMAGLGLGSFVHDINRVDVAEVLASIERSYEQRDELAVAVSTRVEQYRHQLREIGAAVLANGRTD